MNTAFFDYCIKSLKRRKKQVLKTVMAIFLSFTFVAGVLLFRDNMYEWQIQSAKHRFGDWFVMMNGNDSRENAQLKSHPYPGGRRVLLWPGQRRPPLRRAVFSFL